MTYPPVLAGTSGTFDIDLTTNNPGEFDFTPAHNGVLNIHSEDPVSWVITDAGDTSGPPETSGTVPGLDDYGLLYEDDFTTNKGWTARTGHTNNAATFRNTSAEIIYYGSEGQVLIAHRASAGATIYSGAVNGYHIHLPQHFYLKFTLKLTGFEKGDWPSLWARPHPDKPGNGKGEIDFLECFAGHLGGSLRIFGSTMIATSGGTPYALGKDTVNLGIPSSEYNTEHTYEFVKSDGQMTCIVDGVLKGTLNRADVDADAGAGSWNAQFEDDKEWYIRLDHQFGDDPDGSPLGEAGVPASTWLESRQAITYMVIGIPGGGGGSLPSGDTGGNDIQAVTGDLSVVWTGGLTMHLAVTGVGVVVFTWTYASRASSVLVVIPDTTEVLETPGALALDIANGDPGDTVTFSLLGPTPLDAFVSTDLDIRGGLDDYLLRLPALLAGVYTLRTESSSSGGVDVEITILEDALSHDDPSSMPSTAPTRDPAQHWRFYDLRDHTVTWTMTRNPSRWSGLHPPHDFTHDNTTAVDGQALTWEGGIRPWRMEFSGQILDSAEYDQLVFWSGLRRRLWLIDHRNRAWLITIEQFDAQAQIKTNLPWAHTYTVKVVIFMQGTV